MPSATSSRTSSTVNFVLLTVGFSPMIRESGTIRSCATVLIGRLRVAPVKVLDNIEQEEVEPD